MRTAYFYDIIPIYAKDQKIIAVFRFASRCVVFRGGGAAKADECNVGGWRYEEKHPQIEDPTRIDPRRYFKCDKYNDEWKEAPWNALVDLGDYSSACTATIVGADLVLTAEHCLYRSLLGYTWLRDCLETDKNRCSLKVRLGNEDQDFWYTIEHRDEKNDFAVLRIRGKKDYARDSRGYLAEDEEGHLIQIYEPRLDDRTRRYFESIAPNIATSSVPINGRVISLGYGSMKVLENDQLQTMRRAIIDELRAMDKEEEENKPKWQKFASGVLDSLFPKARAKIDAQKPTYEERADRVNVRLFSSSLAERAEQMDPALKYVFSDTDNAKIETHCSMTGSKIERGALKNTSTCYTFGGNSGGPLLVREPNGKYTLVGIHVASHGNLSPDWRTQLPGYAVRPEVFGPVVLQLRNR